MVGEKLKFKNVKLHSFSLEDLNFGVANALAREE